ncbi:MAG: hypothetical protein WCD16_03585 [Paracoccaceae bacterium]
MKPPTRPLFLARQNYRSRRMMDMARLLPVLGLFLFMLPLISRWGSGAGMVGHLIYLFTAWFGLILLAGLMSRRLARLNAEDATRQSLAEEEKDRP